MSCPGCAKLVDEGPHLVVGKDQYHTACFACSGCGTQLAGKAATRRVGKLVCAECAGGNGCHRCKKTIGLGARDVGVGGLHFHEACLTCAEAGCGAPIPTDQLYISPKSAKVDIFCKNHTYV